jgi:hypothetical protein
MRFSSTETTLRSRTFRRAVVVIGAMVMSSDLCNAGSIKLSVDVPAVTEAKAKLGPGWGALVIALSEPATSTSFVFMPSCPTPKSGIADPTSKSMVWQLGPGGYGLGQTGKPSDPDNPLSKPNGPFLLTINFEDETVPKITSAFWQSKPTKGGIRTWTMVTADITQDPKGFTSVPEPSALSLAFSAGCILLVFARWKSAPNPRARKDCHVVPRMGT